jgi:Flp pilus assembly protein TadD
VKRPHPTRARAAPRETKPSAATRRLTVTALVVATLATFSGALRNDWIQLDDPTYVYENPRVSRGLSARSVLWGLRGPHGGNWHPLTSWSHMTDVQLFGLDARGHHAVSLALHAANSALVLLVLARASGAWWRSAAVAALFALHPLRVESVAWVSERKDLLCGLFFLLALGAHALERERPTHGRRAAVLAFAALALLSKPMAVTIPFVIVLLEMCPLSSALPGALGVAPRASLGRAAARWWPLFAMAAASSAVTFVVQRASGGVVSFEHVPFVHRLSNALLSVWRYVGQTAWPASLAPFYPFPRAPSPALAALAAAGIALATGAALARRARCPQIAAGWFWYAGMLFPVIGIVQVGGQAHADRYTYLPSIGLLVAAVWGVGERAAGRRATRGSLAAGAAAAIALLAFATARQVDRWRDTRTLFTHALAVTRDNNVAHLCLGDMLLHEGKTAEALPHLLEAVRLAPQIPGPYNLLGAALGDQGQNEAAAEVFRQALQLVQNADLHHNLGFALARLSSLDEAIREFENALALDPDHLPSLAHLGESLRAAGRLDESERPLRRAVGVAPDDLELRRSLATTLTLAGRVEEAIVEYGAILRADANDLDALVNVAWIRATHAEAAHRDGVVAVAMAERARAASADPVAAIEATAAAAYAEVGRFADAVGAAERAAALARQAGDAPSAERFDAQRAHYARGEPFHFAR